MDKNIKLTPQLKRFHWGEGEWVNEPDFLEFTYREYRCQIKRVYFVEGWNDDHLSLGHLCGYVKIPEDHPCYMKYEDIEMSVHGGLTFYGQMRDYEGIWIGFDCAHGGDYTPSIMKKFDARRPSIPESMKFHPLFNPVYRNIQYVRKQCEAIVIQLIVMENEKTDD